MTLARGLDRGGGYFLKHIMINLNDLVHIKFPSEILNSKEIREKRNIIPFGNASDMSRNESVILG